jgi:hypothetical protein
MSKREMTTIDQEFINKLPTNLQAWATGLEESDLLNILTVVGNAPAHAAAIRPMASANIGLVGEAEIQAILEKRHPIVNTAKSGKCGDFIIGDSRRFLIEVKKYSKTVPGAEIDKFYRDIDSNSSIEGAILISLTSKIVGMARPLVYTNQYVNGNRVPVVFISLCGIPKSMAEECIYASIGLLDAEIDSITKCVEVGDRISYAVDNICTNLDFLSQCRLTLHETQAMFNKQLGKAMQQVLAAEINIKNSVNALKRNTKSIQYEEKKTGVAVGEKLIEFGMDDEQFLVLRDCVDQLGDSVMVTGNIIKTKDGIASLKIGKKKTVATINVGKQYTDIIVELFKLEGDCTYNGKKVTVALSMLNLPIMIKLINSIKSDNPAN